MKNRHPKRKLANKLLSKEERKKGISVFDSKGWEDRKYQKEFKVKKREKKNSK